MEILAQPGLADVERQGARRRAERRDDVCSCHENAAKSIMSLDPNLPVGGCKESGIGREDGHAMIDASTEA